MGVCLSVFINWVIRKHFFHFMHPWYKTKTSSGIRVTWTVTECKPIHPVSKKVTKTTSFFHKDCGHELHELCNCGRLSAKTLLFLEFFPDMLPCHSEVKIKKGVKCSDLPRSENKNNKAEDVKEDYSPGCRAFDCRTLLSERQMKFRAAI